MKDTDKDFLNEIAEALFDEDHQIISKENRRKHLSEIGRKGGLKNRKNRPVKEKYLKIRMTENQLENLQKKAMENNLNLSEYSRLILFGQELKINEFKTDETLLKIARNFKWLGNFLRKKEWDEFENRKEIMSKIESLISETRAFLFNKKDKK